MENRYPTDQSASHRAAGDYSQQSLSFLQEQASFVYLLLNRQGVILYGNAMAQRCLALVPDQPIIFQDQLSLLSLPRWQQALQRLQAHEPVQDVALIWQGSTARSLRFRLTASVSPDGELIHCLLQEDTQRQQQDQRLALLDFALENLNEALLLCDQNGRILCANRRCRSLLGFTNGELEKLNLTQVIPELPVSLQSGSTDTAKESHSIQLQLTCQNKAGESMTVSASCLYFSLELDHFNLILLQDMSVRNAMEALWIAREARFRTLAENLPDNIARYDQHGRLIYVNRQYRKMMLQQGIDTGEILGKTIQEAWQHISCEMPEQYDWQRYTNALMQTLASGVASEVEVVLPDRGDGLRYHMVRLVPEKDANGEVLGALSISYDFTEQKIAERELHLAHAFTENLLNAIPDPIFVKDRQHRWILLNDECCRLIGHPREVLLGKTDHDYFPTKQADIYRAHDQRVFASGEGGQVDESMPDPRGGIRYLQTKRVLIKDQHSSPVLLGIIRDISQLKQMEQALRVKSDEFRALAENAPDPIVRYDRDCRRIYVNPALVAILGEPAERLLGQLPVVSGLTDPVSGDNPVVTAIRQVLATGELVEIDTQHRSPEGENLHLHSRLVPEYQDDGSIGSVLCISRDVTARKLAGRELRLAASVFANSYDGIMITDSNNVILNTNPAFTRITGFTREEAVGKKPSMLSSGQHGRDYYQKMWAVLQEQDLWHGEIWNRRKNGDIYAQMLSISVVRDEAGQLLHYIAMFTDISQLKEHEAELLRIAYRDALTGAPNRRLLADRMAQALARIRRSGKLLGVCYLDLDGFKSVNDSYGHNAGDRLLVEITNRLKTLLRANDTVARIGGDEFALLLTELTSSDECDGVLQRILLAIARPVLIGSAHMHVTASIGLTLSPPDEADVDTLLRHADQAMYIAKKTGKNRYHLFIPGED